MERTPTVVRPDGSPQGFVVQHYAGAVLYETAAFSERNAAMLPDTLCGMPSTNAFARLLLPPSLTVVPATRSVTYYAMNTCANHCRDRRQLLGRHRCRCSFASRLLHVRSHLQLSTLMDRLASTNCHFIRCIRPNHQQQPGVFDAPEVNAVPLTTANTYSSSPISLFFRFSPASPLPPPASPLPHHAGCISRKVLAQLRCAGMGVALRLLHAGLPTRVAFRDLYDR